MPQLLSFGGQGNRHLVILHATGFLAAAYQPLAAALSKEFVVWGLDLPGHGIAADIPLPCECTPSVDDSSSSSSLLSLQGATQYVVDAIQQAGLQGCYAFGHSAGGALALLAAGQCPELFRAVFCFEAVASTPPTHAFMAAASAAGDIVTDGQRLGSMARRRRAQFDSRTAALQHLTAKPPFSRLQPASVALYVQHGLVSCTRPAAADAGLPPQQHSSLTTDPQQLQQPQLHQHSHQPFCPEQQQQQQQPQQEGPVRLLCSPEREAAYFDALQPPPPVNPNSISCPVLLAVAAAPPQAAGAAASSMPASDLTTHAGVQAWFYQQHSGSSSRANRQLHGALRVLNIELAAALPTAQLLEVQGVSHFGPLEQPQLLADSCARFFEAVAADEAAKGDGEVAAGVQWGQPQQLEQQKQGQQQQGQHQSKL